MNQLQEAGRLWRTVKHLRTEQIVGRARFRLARPSIPDRTRPALRTPSGTFLAPIAHPAVMIGPSSFRFINRIESLDRRGWDDPEVDKLWRYNLHYFDDLMAQKSALRRNWHDTLIKRWITDNPVGIGTAWEPYPTSLRIVNWVKHAMLRDGLSGDALQSLATQARWLMKRLEWHLLGNHLMANAKALVFVGSFFDGPEAGQWLRQGMSILDRELGEQFLDDGGHFELSPMYHAIAVEDLLDLTNVLAAYRPLSSGVLWQQCRAQVAKALRWLLAMRHPDGQIAFFNDAAFGVAAEPAEIFDYCRRLGIKVPKSLRATHLLASGYLRLSLDPVTVIADVGQVGPDYLPGHAHADSLSFELSFGTQRIFVNSGTSLYGRSEERHRQRSTPAHNTVVVDGENSSEVWAGFRVGRRARPTISSIHLDPYQQGFDAHHDGYRHLSGRPKHRRVLSLEPGRCSVVDHVSPNHACVARFHLHPDVVPIQNAGHIWLKLPDGTRLSLRTSSTLEVEPTTFHPRFGTSQSTFCLVLPLIQGRSELTLVWPDKPDSMRG